MATIPHYRVIGAVKQEELEQAVCDLLRQGWQLAGGISVVYAPNGSTVWYHQAMTYLETWNW